MYYNGNKVFISNNTNLYFKKEHKCKEDFIMKEKLMINTTKPQYVQVSDITYAQVDSWYDHCRRDLKLDLIGRRFAKQIHRDEAKRNRDEFFGVD